MDPIRTVAVFACSESVEDDAEYRRTKGMDERIMRELTGQLAEYGIRVVQFTSPDVSDRLRQVLNEGPDEADEIILTVDARAPVHPSFARMASCFLGSRQDPSPSPPYVLVTGADAKNADPERAAGALRELWLMDCPYLSDYRTEYPVYYCSMNCRRFSPDGKTFRSGARGFADFLQSTHEYWVKRRRSYRGGS